VVTGKVDVREASVKLPQEAEEELLEDENASVSAEETAEVEEGKASLEEANV
jgi:hypothetical protein